MRTSFSTFGRAVAIGAALAWSGCVAARANDAAGAGAEKGAPASDSVEPAVLAAPIDPRTLGWAAGAEYEYQLKLTSAVAFGEAGNAFDFDLLGTLSIAPVTAAAESTTLFASIPDAKIVSREPSGQTELDKIATELRGAGCFLTLAGGRIVGYRWPRGMSATAANVYRSIGAGLQFARAANGSQRYTAEEYDGTGRYSAEYAADAEQGVWHKRKLKYVDLLTVKGTSTDSPLRIVPAVVSSQGTVALSPEGRPEIIAAEDEVDVKGAQAPVHART